MTAAAHARLARPPIAAPSLASSGPTASAALRLAFFETACVQLDGLWKAAWAAEDRGKFDRAEELLTRAVKSWPTLPQARMHLGMFYGRRGRIDEADCLVGEALDGLSADLAALDWRVAVDRAKAVYSLSSRALQRGFYTPDAWRAQDARHDIPDNRLPRLCLPFPEWRGETLTGKTILVMCEQGFGDQIQFARFLPRLRELGAHVTFVCDAPLAPLFGHLVDSVVVSPVDDAIKPTRSRAAFAMPRCDYWISVIDLPMWLDATQENLRPDPYIFAAPAALPPGARIGVVAKGSPNHKNDHNRSMPARLAAELVALPGATSLHPNDTGARDFAETAAIIAGLELVISVDTSVAHLAGAMGKPVWIMLPDHGCDWRWMRDRTDSPWYPSATLYRQPKPGDWRSVLDRVTADLAAL